MIEFLIELVAGGLFELFAEIAAGIYNRKNDLPIAHEPVAIRQHQRRVSMAKLLLGATAGAFWGYYVGTSSDVSWPLTFWSFAAIGAITFALRVAGFSNEERTAGINNRFVRSMVTFTPERLAGLSMLSLITALFVAVGFLIA